jgi:hypothetical protein
VIEALQTEIAVLRSRLAQQQSQLRPTGMLEALDSNAG